MRLRLFVFWSLVLGGWTNLVWGQAFEFGVYSMEDGLSVYSITEVIQDAQGFLWIGTIDGLNRYDGYNFKVYKHVPGDSSSLPQKVHQIIQ